MNEQSQTNNDCHADSLSFENICMIVQKQTKNKLNVFKICFISHRFKLFCYVFLCTVYNKVIFLIEKMSNIS